MPSWRRASLVPSTLASSSTTPALRRSPRARQRFEQRDWAGARRDAVERIALYDLCIAEQMDALRRLAGEAIGERALWLQVHARYSELLRG